MQPDSSLFKRSTALMEGGFAVLDPRGQVRYANEEAATIVGGEGERAPFWSRFPASAEYDLRAAVQSALDGNRRRLVLSRNGARIHLTFERASFGDGEYVVVATQDEGDVRDLLRALGERERLAALGTATATAAHEINNATGSFVTLLHLLAHPDLPRPDRDEHVGHLRTEADRIAQIVKQLMSLARNWGDAFEVFPVRDVIADALIVRRDALTRERVGVSVDEEVAGAAVLAHRSSVEFVLFAMIDLAIRALAEHPGARHLIVRISHARGQRIGVEMETDEVPLSLTMQCERSGRRQTHTDRGIKAAGLFAAQNNAEIFERAAEGRRRIVFAIPRGGEAFGGAPRPGAPDLTSAMMRAVMGVQILLVEDRPILRRATAKALIGYGPASIVEAASVREAVAALEDRTVEFDVVLLDMRLPDGTGVDVYHAIERLRPELAQRTVFTLGDRVEGDLLRFLSDKEVPYVTKPYHPEDLVRGIASFAGPV